MAILASLALAARSVTAFPAIAGTGFSAYLTYVELAVIHAICQCCVASAIVLSLLAVVSAARYVAGDMASMSRS